VAERVGRLSGSEDQQVQFMLGLYWAAQAGRVDSGVGLDAVEAYLEEVPDIRLRSDTLYELAGRLGEGRTPAELVVLYDRYFEKFMALEDLPSAAACLVILGWTQDAAALPVLGKALSHSEEAIRGAARGGLSLMGAGELLAPEFYSVKFSPMMAFDWDLLRRYGRYPELVMTTELGDIVVRMDAEQAPMGVQNLIQHVEAGRFDDIAFYRVEPNHVVQTAPNGHFGERVQSEFTRIAKEENTMGLGDLGKDTLSQHIAITHLMRPHNEGKYTNLGRVIGGGDIVKTVSKYDPVLRSRMVTNGPMKESLGQ
jgi:cyclophilin family peptidyl-prolyl cis-trans isomerase